MKQPPNQVAPHRFRDFSPGKAKNHITRKAPLRLSVESIEQPCAFSNLTNAGTITSYGGDAVYSFGDYSQFINTGIITSYGGHGIISIGTGADIVNYGLIQSLESSPYYGVWLFDDDLNNAVTLTNFGTISAAGGVAIVGDFYSVDNIYSFGTINGDVRQWHGSDFFRNGGQVVGDVDLGTGNDTFKGWGGTVEGYIHGRPGNDTIIGGASDDAIFGDNNDDLLNGGSGDDTLTGGNGRDVMRGGVGSDTFDFNKTVESALGGQRDRIADFSQGYDLIDLMTIDADAGVGGNQVFTFIGSTAFSSAAGELRATTPSGNTIIAGDTDGDGSADFQILVVGVTGLTEGDFVL